MNLYLCTEKQLASINFAWNYCRLISAIKFFGMQFRWNDTGKLIPRTTARRFCWKWRKVSALSWTTNHHTRNFNWLKSADTCKKLQAASISDVQWHWPFILIVYHTLLWLFFYYSYELSLKDVEDYIWRFHTAIYCAPSAGIVDTAFEKKKCCLRSNLFYKFWHARTFRKLFNEVRISALALWRR